MELEAMGYFLKMDKVRINDKLKLINEYWKPKVVGELNDSFVKIAKLKGEFLWHHHENEDELFWVIKGTLIIKFRDKDIVIKEGELLIVPRGVEHMPVAKEEVQLILIEPMSTLNTGNVLSERTVENPDKI
jgi:mannose-6-phosphate isomerase-like protein (cupin superfamily)